MTDTHTLTELTSALLEVRNVIAAINLIGIEPRDHEARLRQEIQDHMLGQGIKTFEGAGLSITRRVTNTPIIDDLAEVTDQLTAHGLYQQCMTDPIFDQKVALRLAKEHDLPGVGIKTTETLVVTPQKP